MRLFIYLFIFCSSLARVINTSHGSTDSEERYGSAFVDNIVQTKMKCVCVCVLIELGRLGRSSSTSGVRQAGGDVQKQSSLPAREALNQVTFSFPLIITKCFALIIIFQEGDE